MMMMSTKCNWPKKFRKEQQLFPRAKVCDVSTYRIQHLGSSNFASVAGGFLALRSTFVSQERAASEFGRTVSATTVFKGKLSWQRPSLVHPHAPCGHFVVETQ
jgi:hypothetical protein